jgi:hypothetical protein
MDGDRRCVNGISSIGTAHLGLPGVCLEIFMWSSGVSLHMLVSTMYAGVDHALIAEPVFSRKACSIKLECPDLIKMVEHFIDPRGPAWR